MATASTFYFPPTGDDTVDVITNGSKWNLGADLTINWSVSHGFSGEVWPNPALVAQYVGEALSFYSHYANVNFVYTGVFSNPSLAYQGGSDINVSLDGAYLTDTFTLAIGFFPVVTSNNPYLGAPGDIFFNVNSPAIFYSFDKGAAGWSLLLHELGHTLGLKHPHDSGGTGRPTLTQLGAAQFDIDWVSVMSYDDNFDFNKTLFDPATPQILDVIGIQYLYGINWSTNAGDTTYALTTTPFYKTVWDAGGVDQVDASGSTVGWYIELPNVQLSSLVTQKFGFAVPLIDYAFWLSTSSSPHTFTWLEGDIENAIGSSFKDEIYGNDLANFLAGGPGDDYLDGKGGIDTAFFSGAISQYTIAKTASGHIITGLDGVDTLVNVEWANFIDGSIDLQNSGPKPSLETVTTAYKGVLRIEPTSEQAAKDVAQLDAGLTFGAYVSSLIALADDSTIPALIVPNFVTGLTPTSAHLDALAAFAQVQWNSYSAQGVGDPDLGPYEALGLGLSETAEFKATFSAAQDATFIAGAYLDAFGRSATGAQITHFQSQLDFFENLYLSVGIADDVAAVRARGAVVGQMLGFAASEAGNDHADAAVAFLTNAADGSASYGTSLLATYGVLI